MSAAGRSASRLPGANVRASGSPRTPLNALLLLCILVITGCYEPEPPPPEAVTFADGSLYATASQSGVVQDHGVRVQTLDPANLQWIETDFIEIPGRASLTTCRPSEPTQCFRLNNTSVQTSSDDGRWRTIWRVDASLPPTQWTLGLTADRPPRPGSIAASDDLVVFSIERRVILLLADGTFSAPASSFRPITRVGSLSMILFFGCAAALMTRRRHWLAHKRTVAIGFSAAAVGQLVAVSRFFAYADDGIVLLLALAGLVMTAGVFTMLFIARTPAETRWPSPSVLPSRELAMDMATFGGLTVALLLTGLGPLWLWSRANVLPYNTAVTLAALAPVFVIASAALGSSALSHLRDR